jgi:hypothetical protein
MEANAKIKEIIESTKNNKSNTKAYFDLFLKNMLLMDKHIPPTHRKIIEDIKNQIINLSLRV